MRKTLQVLAATVILALVLAAPASALVGEWPPGPIQVDYIRPDIKDLLNSHERVYGYFGPIAQDYFYYAGDTRDFNAFIERYSKLPDTPHVLVLHPGRGAGAKMMGRISLEGGGYAPEQYSYDWAVTCLNLGSSQREYPPRVTLELWLDGNVRFDEVKVPESVEVQHPKETQAGPAENPDAAVSGASASFGMKLFHQCTTQDPGKNVLVSPFSVSSCLTMVYNGADGTTKEAIAKALDVEGLDLEYLNRGYTDLYQSLAEGQDMDASWFTLSIANSLWAREGVTFRQDYMERVTSAYSAELTTLDFADPKALDTINAWANEQTKGKVPKVLDKIGPRDILLLVNSIYFRGKWLHPFHEGYTKELEFTLLNGKKKMHPMMRQEYLEAGYYKGDGFQSVALQYGYRDLCMYIFLPDEDSDLHAFYKKLTPENWRKWMAGHKRIAGTLVMPKFKLEYEPDLDEALKALGIGIAFDDGRADFTKMADQTPEPVYLARTVHKTFVDVNEQGTEAAGITAMMMAAGGAGEERDPGTFDIVVDRPFLYAVRDGETGVILFMGAMLDPAP